MRHLVFILLHTRRITTLYIVLVGAAAGTISLIEQVVRH